MRVLGIDPAFAHMGFVRATIDVATLDVRCDGMHLASTEMQDRKVVRRSSDYLRRAIELHKALIMECTLWRPVLVFSEVPSGAQSASAASALGIAIGVLAGCPVPIIEVSPLEVKRAVAGSTKGNPSKNQIIEWAHTRWPDAAWLRAEHAGRSKRGVLPADRLLDKNEHCADALAAIIAGIATQEFKRALLFHGQNHAATSHHHERPASHRVRLN